ncbi:MAG TPA: metallopeptidase TldD-related protein, partial [Noviherbaspirillum sp.]
NRSAVRQPGHVRQTVLTVDLMHGLRHAAGTIALSGNIDGDRLAVDRMVSHLRAQLAHLPEDPHLLFSTEVHSTEHVQASRLPATSWMVEEVLEAAKGLDLVGFLAAGPVYRGFANSFGQRNWHETASFSFDWSLYQSRDKAVKASQAGFDWDSAAFRAKFDTAKQQLDYLKREAVSVKPGAYRAYLAPAAMFELVGMLNWDGVSEKSIRTKQSSLRRLRFEGARLHPSFTLCENTVEGLAPGFQSDGFIKPERVALIEQGELAGSLISPRTAQEYGIEANGADGGEAMQSIDLAPGSLPMADVLRELDTGIYVSNLWYTNFSDRASCRITGMTRFASFWVENGAIKAPLNVMRFDDSLLRLFGDNLFALTREREMLVDDSTYGGRHTASSRLPGALVKDFTFVL